jgi:chromosome partitioning protein
MSAIRETCSVCGGGFEVQFRYQMEEKEGGFLFFCSQGCLESSQRAGNDGLVSCDACAKAFRVELVSNVLYVRGMRKYACSMECRMQLGREASGARLGEIAAASMPVEPAAAAPVPVAPAARAVPPAPTARPAAPVPPPVRRADPPAAAAASTPKNADGARIIAVFNHKGGTGKTTTSVSLAAGLALRGKRVLLVDTDAQGNVGVSLNVKVERSLYHVVVMGLAVEQAAVTVRPNLDLVASNESLAAAELYLAGRQNRDRVLATRLASAAKLYDYVVLDCSPSLSLMNQNALVFAESVLVPVACDYLSLVGVRQVIRTVKNVNQLLHHPVQIGGVLPTFYDARAKICREAVETMREHFGDRCLEPIRAAIKVKEAPAQGQTIFEYAAGSPAAEDYARVVDRVLAAPAGIGFESASSRAAGRPAQTGQTAPRASGAVAARA